MLYDATHEVSKFFRFVIDGGKDSLSVTKYKDKPLNPNQFVITGYCNVKDIIKKLNCFKRLEILPI